MSQVSLKSSCPLPMKCLLEVLLYGGPPQARELERDWFGGSDECVT
jgi:hypothetical protein